MPSFTLPASKYTVPTKVFMVGPPFLQPGLWVSDFMISMEIDFMYYVDADGLIQNVELNSMIPHSEQGGDFLLDGTSIDMEEPSSLSFKPGNGFVALHHKNPSTGTSVTFIGEGWCNVFTGTPPDYVSDCPQ